LMMAHWAEMCCWGNAKKNELLCSNDVLWFLKSNMDWVGNTFLLECYC
jgi:hypothetical protein